MHMQHKGIVPNEHLLFCTEMVSDVVPTLLVYGILIFRQVVASTQDRITRLATCEITTNFTRQAFGCGRKLSRKRRVFWGGCDIQSKPEVCPHPKENEGVSRAPQSAGGTEKRKLLL
ncbi:hypothetical protein N7G274_003663 [Stereocaulon virgatum]|uniref:Uncharacterized protein n=1 Tax=Stereocaulon virgatum TaxID=373712 RepID=A0ABR4ABX7_9LECA